MNRTKPLHIEMVLPTLHVGGMEMMVRDLTWCLVNQGHHLSVTCTGDLGVLADELSGGGVRVGLIRTPGIRRNIWPGDLAARFRETRPDVVHVHSGAWLPAVRAARMVGVRKIIHTVHGVLEREPWFDVLLKRASATFTDAIVAVSEPLRKHMVDRIGISARKVQVVQNGIDTSRFTPGTAENVRVNFAIPVTAPLIGMVARLERVKNPGLLLQAFSHISDAVPSAYLLYVGDGSERRGLERRAAELKLSDRVRFAGVRRDTSAMFRALDIVVLPSNAEGSPVSILEAMASGKAIIATNVGGVPEQLGYGECGVLTPANDGESLSASLAWLLKDPSARADLGSRARVRAESLYGLAPMVKAYLALYEP